MVIIKNTISRINKFTRGRIMELIAILFPVVIVICLLYIIWNIYKKKKMPSNNYTPFDDITEGRKK